MNKTWKPIVVGILDLVLGIALLVLSGTMIYFGLQDLSGWGGLFIVIAIIFMPFSILLIAAGICSLRRRAWMFVFVINIVMLIPTGFLSIFRGGYLYMTPTTISLLMSVISVILLILSKDEFVKIEKGPYRLRDQS